MFHLLHYHIYIYTYIYMWKRTKEVRNQYVNGCANPFRHPSKDSQQLIAWLWIKILVWTFSTSRLLNGLLNVHPPISRMTRFENGGWFPCEFWKGDDLGLAQVGNGPAIPCFWLVLISMIGCRYPLLGLVIFIAGTIHNIYIYTYIYIHIYIYTYNII